MTGFVDILSSLKKDGAYWKAEITEDWMQGRTVFGGLLAALAVGALRRDLTIEAPLRSLDVAFIAPVPEGTVGIQVEMLRTGRYVTHAAAEIVAGEQRLMRVLAVFGKSRESKIGVATPGRNASMEREKGIEMPFIPGLTPEFSRHFEFWFTEGEIPLSGAEDGVLGGYFRHRPTGNESGNGSGSELNGTEAIVALLDAWPPAVLPLGDGPFMASTVRWACQFVNDVPEGFDDYWWYRAETIAARDGYATTKAQLYAGDILVAWSEQLVAYFA